MSTFLYNSSVAMMSRGCIVDKGSWGLVVGELWLIWLVYIDQSHAKSSIGQSDQDTIAVSDQSHAEQE
jgi:hypothetical protein